MPKITFPSTGKEFEVDAGTSLLDFCQSNDTPVSFGCTSGACGTCCSIVEAAPGAIADADEDELELIEHTTDEKGARLCCLLTVNGDIKVTPL